jgi:hypothetical protein
LSYYTKKQEKKQWTCHIFVASSKDLKKTAKISIFSIWKTIAGVP